MDLAFTLLGSAPLVRKYQVNSTFANAGVIARAPGAENAGVVIGTTTSAADAIGVCQDTATYVTAQQTDNTSAERKLSVITNFDAVYRALMSGGATEGTALALHAIITADTAGLALTTGTAWDSPTFDEGAAFGYDGANAGQLRKITSVSTTAGTVTVAFDYDTVVNDNFIRVPYWPNQTVTVQFTTNLYQADAIIAVGTGASCRVVDLEMQDIGGEGRTKSHVLFMLNDHIFKDAT